MRLGRRLSTGIADDPPAPVAEVAPEVPAPAAPVTPVAAPAPRAEADREYAGHPAEH